MKNTLWDYFMMWGFAGLIVTIWFNVIPFAISMESRIKKLHKLIMFYFVTALILGPFVWIVFALVALIAAWTYL